MRRLALQHERVFRDEGFAAEYARKHQTMAERFGQEYARKLTARGFRAGTIIDVGCGPGGTAIALARAFPDSEVVGIDLSEPLLRRAELAAEQAGLDRRVRFELADVQHMPYRDDTFDAVINLNMVHLVEDPRQMLDEIERVLAPQGHLFVADLRRSWLGLLEGAIRSALSLPEARDLFGQSGVRPGAFSSTLLWWRFESA